MKKKIAAALVIHLAIVVSTLLAVGGYFVGGPDVLGSKGTQCLKYFTTDSNILAAVGSAAGAVYCVRRLRDPGAQVPVWVRSLKFAGTVAVTITLLTVVFFLAPVASLRGGARQFLLFFRGNVFALHLSTPVLALVSLICLERDEKLPFRHALWGLAPTVVYSIVYFLMVVVLKRWTDWYGFTFGGKAYMIPVAFVSMYLATAAVCAVLYRLGKKGLRT